MALNLFMAGWLIDDVTKSKWSAFSFVLNMLFGLANMVVVYGKMTGKIP